MDEAPERRVAANEVTMRAVNEGIERGQWPGEEDKPVTFRCECARLGCNRLVALTLREYQRIRSNPRWFVLVPGHETVAAERVVRSAPGYVVVEKRDEAGELAEALDPRS